MRLLANLAVPRRGILFLFLLAYTGAVRGQGWVVIPVGEYGALRSKAFPVERDSAGPAVEATLTRVDYELRVEGDLASGSAVLTIDVLKDGWVQVAIPAGLMVKDARMGGRPASLVRGAAVLTKRGRSVLQLEIAMPVAAGSGEERLVLPASASGVTRASLTLSRPDVEVKVAGGLMAERGEGEGETRLVAYARGNVPLVLTWRRKMEEQKRAPQALRMRGALAELLALGEDVSSVTAEVTLDVSQGAAPAARIAVPVSVTVNSVSGASVADWVVKDGELSVTFLEPVGQKAGFVIQAETRLAREGAIHLPVLRLLDADRESGGVAVEVLGAGEIQKIRTEGLERCEAGDLGSTVAARQSPSMVAFRFRAGSAVRSLDVDVARYAQQAVLTANIEEARYRALLTADGKTLVEARYAVRNNQRNFVRIMLPRGAALWSASLSGKPVRPGLAPDGSLLFPLAKARAGEDAPAFAIAVLYLSPGVAWTDKGRATLALPVLDLPVSRTGVELYHPPLYRVTPETGAFRVQPFSAAASPALLSEAAPSTSVVSMNAAPSPVQTLVDGYRARRDALRRADAAPLRMSFPAVGPSLFLASELTVENATPNLDMSYQKDRKGGVR